MAVTLLHLSELGGSGLALLGKEFLFRFYYGCFLEDPTYFCYFYTVDGIVAGFTSFSSDVRKVCLRGVYRNWPALAWTVLAAIANRPARISTVFELAGSLFSMKREPYSEILAEGMSTAVAKPYRSLEFYQRTGINIATALYLTMARVLAQQGVKQVKGFTMKSNMLVSTSLSYLGWKKVYEGFHPRGSREHEKCLWIWDLEAAVKRFPPPGERG